MVATGPMPGRTPIRVPTSAPIKAYKRLMGVSATPKPRARWLNRSTVASVRPGPERQLEIQAENKDTGRERGKKNSADQSFLRSELRTRRARGKDQAEGNDATQYDEHRLPIPPRKRFTFDFECAQGKRSAEHKEEDAEDTRKVAWPHAGGAAKRIVAADNDRSEA